MLADSIRALVFDVFGTCTDWRGSIIREIDAAARAKGLAVDSSAMADEWRREGYLLAGVLLDLQPEQVMLVAAHESDLKGAQAAGLHTALVSRPGEWGPSAPPLPPPDSSFDFVATDFLNLANQLGA